MTVTVKITGKDVTRRVTGRVMTVTVKITGKDVTRRVTGRVMMLHS